MLDIQVRMRWPLPCQPGMEQEETMSHWSQICRRVIVLPEISLIEKYKIGGNGLGCQPDISYTLTSADRHAVFSRQRSDEFLQNRVTATQSARQHKDATDLVCEPYQNTVGTIGYTDHKGINNQYVSEDKCIVENRRLIRRLTPLEV